MRKPHSAIILLSFGFLALLVCVSCAPPKPRPPGAPAPPPPAALVDTQRRLALIPEPQFAVGISFSHGRECH
jgi:hypothetical protein